MHPDILYQHYVEIVKNRLYQAYTDEELDISAFFYTPEENSYLEDQLYVEHYDGSTLSTLDDDIDDEFSYFNPSDIYNPVMELAKEILVDSSLIEQYQKTHPEYRGSEPFVEDPLLEYIAQLTVLAMAEDLPRYNADLSDVLVHDGYTPLLEKRKPEEAIAQKALTYLIEEYGMLDVEAKTYLADLEMQLKLGDPQSNLLVDGLDIDQYDLVLEDGLQIDAVLYQNDPDYGRDDLPEES